MKQLPLVLILLLLQAPGTGLAQESQESQEKVTGIGGFFFRAEDPAALSLWYEQHLGITPVPGTYEEEPWTPAGGATVFSPFPKSSTYFGPASQSWMINFRVGNLDRLVSQLRSAGIDVEVDPQTYPNGRFARLNDPEGNPIQLWQPR